MRFGCTVPRPADQNLTRQGLQAGTFHCPGDGGKAWPFNEMNGWRNQNLNRLYCAGASKGAAAWQGLWSWGKHKSVCVGGGVRGHCSRAFIKRRWCTGARRYSASMWTYCSVHAQSHSLSHTHTQTRIVTRCAVLFDARRCRTRGEVARSHAAALAELHRRVSPPLKAELDSPLLKFWSALARKCHTRWLGCLKRAPQLWESLMSFDIHTAPTRRRIVCQCWFGVSYPAAEKDKCFCSTIQKRGVNLLTKVSLTPPLICHFLADLLLSESKTFHI